MHVGGSPAAVSPATRHWCSAALEWLAVGAAAQQRGVARLQAQGAGVRGHVRPALVDDADHSERHAHALDAQAVGTLPFGHRGADRVGQRAHRIDAGRDGLDAARIEAQPLELGSAQLRSARRRQVALVGGQDRAALRAHRRSRGRKRCILLRRGSQRQDLRRGGGGPAEPVHQLAQGGGVHGPQGTLGAASATGAAAAGSGRMSTRSSRWIISSRPRKPSSSSISEDLRPRMRAAS